ncbi:type IV secretion system protein VirB9 [Sphingopyxis italica]|uniref:Type IV secretion system protein VirB9 n=1 Tax=Sphingopyxis italica TaxID=1129133 RepID=A0A7X6B9A2_9SPHN|nr:P-type conjugative transfer protein TrbG [Sphingopyxis sp. SE2]MDT7529009.1 P-type conjugative transfer protein TrbG [Sphingopyxis sp. SE2]NJB90079.1 type IV secretion system protein VirB9 [Sphingopyxis italica]
MIRFPLLLGALALGLPAHAAPGDPKVQVGRANDAARVQPERATFQGAIQKYAWADGALFQIYTAPGQVTDIALQEGEELVGPGPVAAGDTVRWIIGDTLSGAGVSRRVHILVKPTRPDIMTNLVINTSRRTYHIELRATPSTYMAGVSWSYPQDELIALRAAETERERLAPVAGGIDFAALNFAYRISGDKVAWRPQRVFDDGRQLFVEFGANVATAEMPPLFILGDKGAAELVNYRVQGRFMIVDRLFERAELRLGSGRAANSVRIERDAPRRRSGK